MKRSSIIALSTALVLFTVAQLSVAAQINRNGRNNQDGRVCLYQNDNYSGWEECYKVGDEVTALQPGHNSQASSIRIYGRVRAIVYAENGFKGASTEFDSDVPVLRLRAAPEGHTWNDRIMSLRVVSEYGGVGVGGGGVGGGGGVRRPDVVVPAPAPVPQGRGISEGICVYARPNYQGREECWRAGEDLADLRRRSGFDNQISSVRVFGGARAIFYRNANFRGQNLVVDRDIPDLSRMRMEGNQTWNNQISSVQIDDARGRGRGRGRDRDRY
jgi:hypothetical protein